MPDNQAPWGHLQQQPPQDPRAQQGWPQQGQPYGQQPYQGQPPQQQGQYGQQQGDQPYQDQQPYGQQPPYGRQPPYAGPAHGNRSPQQPRRKRHVVRNIFAGFGALIVVIVVISVITSKGGVSTTATGGTATTAATAAAKAPAHAAAAVIGSSFQVSDGSGDTYRVTLSKIIDPAQGADQYTTADSGKRFVGAVFTITAVKGSPQDEDANNDAAVVGSNGQTYTADFDAIAGYTDFSDGTINIAEGDTANGAVTFQLPDGVKVTQIQWTAGGGFGSTVQWEAKR